MEREKNNRFIERLSPSQIYQDYEHAFTKTTRLPLSLRPPEVWQLAHHGKKSENAFCALLAGHNHACIACLEVQPPTEFEFTSLRDSASRIAV